MITITYRDDGAYRSLTVEGHAGYAEKGKDIICSAASALMMSLQSALEDSGTEYKIDAWDGYAEIACEDVTAKPWFYMAMRGFFTLASEYPAYYDVKSV